MAGANIRKADLAFVESYLHTFASDGVASTSPADLFRNRSWSRHDEGAFCLTDQQARDHEAISRRLSTSTYRLDDLSAEAIESALLDAMFIVLDLPKKRSTLVETRVNDAIDQLLSFFNTDLESFECWLPVDGLPAASLPAAFGQCRLEVIGSNHFEHVASLLRSNGGPHVEENISALLPMLARGMEGQVAAIVQLKAKETGAALNMATGEVQATLECLNFFGPTMPFNYSTLSLSRGQSDPGVSHRLAISTEGSVSHGSSLTSMPASYSVNELQSLPAPIGAAVKLVDSLLRQESRSAVAELLIRAVRWAGRAVAAETSEDKLLFFTIALECVALPDGEAELSYRLSERVARAIGTDLDSRQSAFDDAKRLYHMRSSIVHGGQKEISEYDVATIHAIAFSFINHMLTDPEVRAMQSIKDLRKYFNRITMA